MAHKILIVEDDHDINNLVAMNLKAAGYDVEKTEHGGQGLQMALTGSYDLMILDIMLPEVDGLEICRRLRAQGTTTPIMMLTAKDGEIDRVVGLEMGADDYLTKPFSVRELQARVKAMLRRVEMMRQADVPTDETLHVGELTINPSRRVVTLKGQVLELTSTEFDLLLYLARHPGMVFSRTQLLDNVWGYQHSGYEHTVNSHINRLRTKIEADPSQPQYVLTVWGVGYKFNDA
ncbi:MAG: response regulator transcription factor [Hahellaceae bacterium]|nr:response regulator transcription factor [Hahellaceae bacterium]MCP5209732.1 response regulator transcription factor [Hahellaceae bacterium]